MLSARAFVAIVVAALALTLTSACTLGDGEGPRYTGRVTKASASQLCVGPNSSSPAETCGSLPLGLTDTPLVGQCVSLFTHFQDEGQQRTWTEASLHLKVDESKCKQTP
jgi:hypothetical protein